MKVRNYVEYEKPIKAKRIIANPHSNDFNDEPEYKLQKVRIYGESKTGKSYIVDSYGKFKFHCPKSRIFLNKKDLENKIDNIEGFELTNYEKEYLLEIFWKEKWRNETKWNWRIWRYIWKRTFWKYKKDTKIYTRQLHT